ncbi:MAG TPA: menaquinone biosynthesis decarboxylase [Bacteroidales bacterium]|nr:menaquinone biosynthesis decarboxylase [Bacteroidales bacterium]HQK67285.1 menaquinone biosynthesis decarboxylase [Bacteroidales bacterium]
MPYSGLAAFIASLEKAGELVRINTYTNPLLEITEITDRVTKSGGKALLFENNGTGFPLLINTYASDNRMAMALRKHDLAEVSEEMSNLLARLTSTNSSFRDKIRSVPGFLKLSGYFPVTTGRKGICQTVIHKNPDLDILPVLKCWPHDGGRFITLPMVHTIHPVTRKTNIGMYRMQILDKNLTAMHWQLHKTGAAHFDAWKKTGRLMPVSVALGGDPIYAYAATAPLPENLNEYILAGFLRRKKVKLVKCITNELYVPYDADIIIEGFVDPSEEPVSEGPFGDHTGFYSLSDLYPAFHVTCITHSANAVYPATVVGIPPMEDAWLTKATEKIFLPPLKLIIQPEIEDLHMPDAGVAHNLAIVKINKSFPGQGKKVISSLSGAGQMMFTKYLIVVSGEIDIRDYRKLFTHICGNTDLRFDFLFTSGPLDVLDHSSETFAVGGKLGIDASEKLKNEKYSSWIVNPGEKAEGEGLILNQIFKMVGEEKNINRIDDLHLIIVGADVEKSKGIASGIRMTVMNCESDNFSGLIVIVDHTVDVTDLFTVAWQVLANTDPVRDIDIVDGRILVIDGTIKAFREDGFPRRWPNVVCSSQETIEKIDIKWNSLGIGPFIKSPSLKNSSLCRPGDGHVITN